MWQHTVMDDRVKRVIEREEAKKTASIELREKYRRVLRQTLMEFDVPGQQHIVYENEKMLDKAEEELEGHVKRMERLGGELEEKVEHVEKKLEKCNSELIQRRVELLNQQIRILESAVKYIQDNK